MSSIKCLCRMWLFCRVCCGWVCGCLMLLMWLCCWLGVRWLSFLVCLFVWCGLMFCLLVVVVGFVKRCWVGMLIRLCVVILCS